jgi:hypothetical protein
LKSGIVIPPALHFFWACSSQTQVPLNITILTCLMSY